MPMPLQSPVLASAKDPLRKMRSPHGRSAVRERRESPRTRMNSLPQSAFATISVACERLDFVLQCCDFERAGSAYRRSRSVSDGFQFMHELGRVSLLRVCWREFRHFGKLDAPESVRGFAEFHLDVTT